MEEVFKRLKPGTRKPEQYLRTIFENGKYILQQYRDEKAQGAKVKLQEEEQDRNSKKLRKRKGKNLRSRLQRKN